jgi:hypothetical protein
MSDERAAHTGDAISREAVQHVINQHFLRGSERDFARWEKARDAIAALPALAPPADVERLVDEPFPGCPEKHGGIYQCVLFAQHPGNHRSKSGHEWPKAALLAACRPGRTEPCRACGSCPHGRPVGLMTAENRGIRPLPGVKPVWMHHDDNTVCDRLTGRDE